MDWRRFANPTQVLYRGTQTETATRGVRGALSYTPSLPVATIWSARPGDVWGQRSTSFLTTSTIHAAEVTWRRPLRFGEERELSVGFDRVLQALHYGQPEGITEEEARKVLNYLHNRITGKARGGDFGYRVTDEDGEEITDADIPFSLTRPITIISEYRDDQWGYEPTLDTAAQLEADVFVFADAPAVQRAAQRLGYDAIIYADVFIGGEFGAEELLDVENVEDLPGVFMAYDEFGEDWVPAHNTVRPLVGATVQPLWQVPATWEEQ